MKKPTYSLRPGDQFIAEDNQTWTVDEVQVPSDWTSLPQVGERPKTFTILAHQGQKNRRFFYQGTRLVEVKRAP